MISRLTVFDHLIISNNDSVLLIIIQFSHIVQLNIKLLTFLHYFLYISLCKTCFRSTMCTFATLMKYIGIYVTNLIHCVITDKKTHKCKYMLFLDKTLPTASPYMCVCLPPWTAEVHRNERGRDLSFRPPWETQQQSPAVGLCVGSYGSNIVIECM